MAPTACAQRQDRTIRSLGNRRTHVAKRMSSPDDRIWTTGPRIKPHHAVVHQNTRARGHDPGAESGHDRLS